MPVPPRSSHYVEVNEMRVMLAWLRDNVTDGEKWLKVMYEALPEEDEEEKAGAPAPATATAQDATLAPSSTGAPPSPPAKAPVATTFQKIEVEFAEGGKMDLAEFTAWMKVGVHVRMHMRMHMQTLTHRAGVGAGRPSACLLHCLLL